MHADVRHALTGQGLHQRLQMGEHAVHAPVGDKAQQMNPPGSRLGGANQLGQHGTYGQGAVLDGQIDAHDVLIDDAPGSEVQVADLGVAHLSVGQTDVTAHALEFPLRAGRQEGVHMRSPGQAHGISRTRSGLAPAVQNQQYARFLHLPSPEVTLFGRTKAGALE